MIEMPYFPDPEWYLKEVRNVLVDGRTKDKELIQKKYLDVKADIEGLLSKVISEEDFSCRISGYTLFDKLILASYEELEKIYIRIKDKWKMLFYENSDMKQEWKKIHRLYDKMIRKNVNSELIRKYGLKCCPYCNENYVVNRERKNGIIYATAQLDHFYPRDKFPIFAVSLYNLVPCCSSCNHIKQTKEIEISPHNHSLEFSHLKISYIPMSVDWISNPEEIEIQFKYDMSDKEFEKGMERNLDVMGIKSSYMAHTDYMQEILKKAQIYGKETRGNLLKDFPDLFSSDEELIRTIFGNYIETKDLLKRPLSKMTQDLLEELKVL